MICIRPTVAIAFLLLVCILAKPAQSWEPTDNRRTRSLRGFSHSAEVSVTKRLAAARALVHFVHLRTVTYRNHSSRLVAH